MVSAGWGRSREERIQQTGGGGGSQSRLGKSREGRREGGKRAGGRRRKEKDIGIDCSGALH